MKKFVSTLLVFALMFVFSTSAFAAKGIGDDMLEAVDVYPGKDIHLYIEDWKDEDWFKWVNNSGKMKVIRAQLKGKTEWWNFKLGFKISYKNYVDSSLLFADDKYQEQEISYIYVPDGAKVSFVVKKMSGSHPSQYQFWMDVMDEFK